MSIAASGMDSTLKTRSSSAVSREGDASSPASRVRSACSVSVKLVSMSCPQPCSSLGSGRSTAGRRASTDSAARRRVATELDTAAARHESAFRPSATARARRSISSLSSRSPAAVGRATSRTPGSMKSRSSDVSGPYLADHSSRPRSVPRRSRFARFSRERASLAAPSHLPSRLPAPSVRKRDEAMRLIELSLLCDESRPRMGLARLPASDVVRCRTSTSSTARPLLAGASSCSKKATRCISGTHTACSRCARRTASENSLVSGDVSTTAPPSASSSLASRSPSCTCFCDQRRTFRAAVQINCSDGEAGMPEAAVAVASATRSWWRRSAHTTYLSRRADGPSSSPPHGLSSALNRACRSAAELWRSAGTSRSAARKASAASSDTTPSAVRNGEPKFG
mmetsp:Transcript_46567/g.152458  ORF Transcript_46567/g.152458 Transcript_46567/m.152458 type:complete len:397 (-) Transcript_46567:4464-5654(-)